MIQVEALCVSFGQSEILHRINCEFHAGEITGIMGRNGSGKTVLLKSLCGFVVPQSGRIMIDGKSLTPKNAHTFSIGALIETPGFLREYSGYRNLLFLSSLTQGNAAEKVKTAMQTVGLDWKLKKRVGTYSLGMRQRLGLAQAMLDDPDILILDEPMNGLDQAFIAEMRELLKSLALAGKTILIASHDMEDLKYLCKTVYTMENGILHV